MDPFPAQITRRRGIALAKSLLALFVLSGPKRGMAAVRPSLGAIADLRSSEAEDPYVQIEGYHVAGDDGGGLFVLDPTDTTSADNGATVIVNAASRRYKRRWSDWFDFRWAGAVGDGAGSGKGPFTGTDNAPAWNRISYLGRQATAAGQGFKLYIPPGQFNFDAANCGYQFFFGIDDLHIRGAGQDATILQNTYNGANGNLQRPISLSFAGLYNVSRRTIGGVRNGHPLSWLINNTASGDKGVTLRTAADAAAFPLGAAVAVTSIDTMPVESYPPDPGLCEYHTVTTAGNASTGFVGLDAPLQNKHLSALPDWSKTGASFPCGAARIWLLSSPNMAPDPLAYPATYSLNCSFNIHHVFEDLTIGLPLNMAAYGMSIGGRHVEYIRCRTPGPSPSIAQIVHHQSCEFTSSCEPDKMVTEWRLDDVRSPYAVGFQSASIENIIVNGGHFSGFNPGGKYNTLNNPNLDSFAFGAEYGFTRSTVINGGVIRGWTSNPYRDVGGSSFNSIDGTSISYANGVFTVVKFGSLQATYHWGLALGQQLNIATKDGNWSGDAGTGVITSMTEDSTHVYVGTTLPYASLPSWAGDKPIIRVRRQGALFVKGTTGCDQIRAAAAATLAGYSQQDWGYVKAEPFDGKSTSGYLNGGYGRPKAIVVNVNRPSITSGSTFILTIYLRPFSTPATQRTMDLTIDLTAKGKRVLSRSGFSGVQPTDSIKYNGSTITKLPADLISIGPVSWRTSSAEPLNRGAPPIVDVEVSADPGLYGRRSA